MNRIYIKIFKKGINLAKTLPKFGFESISYLTLIRKLFMFILTLPE